MVRNFWNPDEIALPDEGKDIPPGFKECLAFQAGCDSILKREETVQITEEHFKNVEDANELVQAYQPHWFDIEAMICFFTHCTVYGDRQTFLPAFNRVQALANEVKEFGWNQDRTRRLKALALLENEIYQAYPDLFVRVE
ncbi:hypothetical protein [Enterobacter phage EC152]